MKKYYFTLLIILQSLLVSGQAGWMELNALGQSQPFSGIPRARDYPACFAIGNNIYYGTGAIDYGLSFSELSDYSKFTISNNHWSGSNYFPGAPRLGAIAFSDSVNGYVMLGFDDNGNNYTDNWKYDPVADTWTQISSFPGLFRGNAFSFSVGGKFYVGNGIYNGIYLSDLWMYDPITDTWIQKNDPPFSPLIHAHCFTIDSFAYMCGGTDSMNNFLDTVYKYDPSNDSWIAAGNFPGTGISFSFATDSFGYAATDHDFYQYNPVTTAWTMKANVPALAVGAALGFSNRGYIIEANCSIYQYDEVANLWQTVFNSQAGSGYLIGTSVVWGDTVYINSSKYNYVTDNWTLDPNFSPVKWLWKSGSKAGLIVNGIFQLFDFSTYSTIPAAQPPVGPTISFMASGRYFAGLGYDTTSNPDYHLYEYDFTNDQWMQRSPYPGTGWDYMVAFGVDSFGYAGGGFDNSGSPVTEFWMYNPTTDQWTMKASIPVNEAVYSFSASYNGKGYIGLGADDYQGNLGCEVYSYNATTDAWVLVPSPFGCRKGAYAFSAGNNLFVGGGSYRYSPNYSDYYSDLWKYDDATTQISDIADNDFSVMTAASGNSIIISGIRTNSTIQIIDLSGRILFNEVSSSHTLTINTSDFGESVYFVMVNDKVSKIALMR